MKKYFILFICLIGVLFTSCEQKEDPYVWSTGQMEFEESYNVTPEVESEPEPFKPRKYETSVQAPRYAEDAVVLGTKYSEEGMLIFLQIPGNPNREEWKNQEYAILGIFYREGDYYRPECQTYRRYETAKKNFDAGVVRDAM